MSAMKYLTKAGAVLRRQKIVSQKVSVAKVECARMNEEQIRRRLEFYRDLGIDQLYRRERRQQSTGAAPPIENPSISQAADPIPLPSLEPENDSLERIRTDIGDCRRCRLCEQRKNIVFGVGNEKAKLVFVGEGPGADEDEQGIPFVGRAGQLLTQMIDNTASKEGIPIKRGDVYICNVVKCRPPENRAPQPDEMEICGQYLYRQLMAIQPKAICALGATAMRALLNSKLGITKMRGEWQKWNGIPLMISYHPSYLLRQYNQEAKRQAWEDLKKVLHFVYD